MEASVSQRGSRADSTHAGSSGKARIGDKEKADDRNKSALHRKTYKEKFNALRDKYEHVTATRAQYERELAVANDKIKKLENECNLLLDAVDIAAPSQPSILHFLTHDPIPAHFHLQSGVTLQPTLQAPPEQLDALPQVSQEPTNGVVNGHENGRC